MSNLSNSPITQVSQVPTHTNLQPQLLTRLFLDLRGRRFEVDRETIMNLPESVLLCLFPNGLVLSRQSVALSDGGGDDDEEEVYGVDVRTQHVLYNLTSCGPADIFGPSSTPTVFNLYSPSFEMHQITSMARLRPQGSMARSNTCLSHPLRNLALRLLRTLCCQSRPSLFLEKN
jgi:hypothetical protein